MNFLDRTRLTVARMLVKGFESDWAAGRLPQWIEYGFVEPTFRALVYEGYRANAAVFACMESMAFAFIEPQLKVLQHQKAGGVQELPDHDLAHLLRQPMPQVYPTMGGTELQQASIVNCQIGGNAYWHKVRGRSNRVVELQVMSDAHITPMPGDDRPVGKYEFRPESGEAQNVPVQDIVHFKWMWNPLTPWHAVAPLVAAARETDTDNEAARYVFAVLKNNAVPPLAVVAPANEDWSDKDKRKRLRESWQEQYGGENRGMPAFLWGGVDVKRISYDLSELAFEGLRRLPESRICAVLRVPPVVAGLLVGLENSGGLNSNAQTAAKWMTERTLVPLWHMFEQTITASFDKDFNLTRDRVFVAYDLSTVVSLQEALNEKRTWAVSALQAGGITRNEFRAYVGQPRDANGDVYLTSMAVIEVPAEIEPTDANAGTSKDAPEETPARLPVGESKARAERRQQRAAAIAAAQRRVRNKVAADMEKAVDDYFAALAQRVDERARKTWTPEALATKALPKIEALLLPEDDEELAAIVKRYYVNLLELSWDGWNVALGVELAWDETDPIVTEILGDAAKRVRMINDTTREEIRTLLQLGSDGGWSVDHLVRGDPENDIPGLRDIVQETYKNRARCIARTELGTAQNLAAAGRYNDAGVTHVDVLDNGKDDDDEPCQKANGQRWTVAKATKNPLEHPN